MQPFARPTARRVTAHEAVAIRQALAMAAVQAREYSANATAGAYDEQLLKYDLPGKSWMLI